MALHRQARHDFLKVSRTQFGRSTRSPDFGCKANGFAFILVPHRVRRPLKEKPSSGDVLSGLAVKVNGVSPPAASRRFQAMGYFTSSRAFSPGAGFTRPFLTLFLEERIAQNAPGHKGTSLKQGFRRVQAEIKEARRAFWGGNSGPPVF
jgi:hypothetical protein